MRRSASGRDSCARSSGAPTASGSTAFGRHLLAHGVRLAYHHHMGAYVETPADVDRLMEVTGDEVGPAVRQRPHDVRRRRRGRDARQARRARLPRPLQGRAALRDPARAQPQLELPRVGDQRRVHGARRRRDRLPGAARQSCTTTVTAAGSSSRRSRTPRSRRATSTPRRGSGRFAASSTRRAHPPRTSRGSGAGPTTAAFSGEAKRRPENRLAADARREPERADPGEEAPCPCSRRRRPARRSST